MEIEGTIPSPPKLEPIKQESSFHKFYHKILPTILILISVFIIYLNWKVKMPDEDYGRLLFGILLFFVGSLHGSARAKSIMEMKKNG